MRTRTLLLAILVLGVPTAAIALIVGCASDNVTAPRPETDRSALPDQSAADPRLGAYLPASTPANVVRNLETAYAKRDIDAYTQLFAPEFTFRFQPQDAAAGHESWGLEAELQSTRNMSYSAKVSRIEIRLEVELAVPASEAALQHTMLVVVNHTFLKVTLQDGQVMEVNGDRQEMYLRRADDEQGNERWLIVEWRDLPGS